MDSLAVVISDPTANFVENQILSSLLISNNIIISFCDFNLIEIINSIIEKNKLEKIVHLVQYEKTSEIEFNPLIENPDPVSAFWNNISRINGVNLITTELLNKNDIEFILFLNYNEVPKQKFTLFYDKIDKDYSYIFNGIILLRSNLFLDDLNIIKILMNENERIGSAKINKYIEFTTNYNESIYFGILE